MRFGNLILRTKTVEVEGVKVTVRKWTVAFSTRYRILAQEIFGDENNKAPRPTNDQLLDFFGEQLFEGLAGWDLKYENDEPAPLTLETCREIVGRFMDFHVGVLQAIRSFNSGLDDESKKN